ncbi:molybdopterin synthase catalytic subunit/molybdopterin synthase sulfur carrier subunit [Evansella caseinilytica]|uniref:Molybdopterin synthase sulfur carrier subunit n=1 Tax=Evansella caseinilytica TaxID=1503961 RepID=A0A1H3PLW9_9BACI|nr:molybdopterin converting factor subunit 1 [Evansella caseinilytica]SDZ01885.1 molybdopterin synthase catalytic subunit/molybdopterin synthase sulfur carrier subunit [Evansella caseinilytica]
MIKVLLFADLEERAGQRIVEIPTAEMNIADIRRYLLDKFPQLSASIRTAMPAINEEYAADQAVASSGDEVAFIPPVSGG